MKSLKRFFGIVGMSLMLAAPLAQAKPSTPASDLQLPKVYKVQLAKGVSADDAADSMKLRANALNIKLVSELPLSKQVEAVTGKPQRRMTIFQFCDAVTAKELVDLNLDYAIFLPCRVALIEDKNGQVWLIMMDMNVDQLAREGKMSKALKQKISKVRNDLIEIINAGAKGDL
ncbi:hypothetical protein TPL01_28670 [Sulfuriferula plumbiphila]|uniref:DUF302 domain-containing protein n=1 Tax=Sulfuriferula plumbiphila TaxID=171865 RepID=A0A512LB65_9PROT|nr:DUF302 domain-containing protein [Sulfuriferula plumbiphila]BBP04345.1 hypothetical protein SFPGR_17670 [Sulfuriferula plumbiphila]GEP31729.1 hypothetical protein TPL01_28670 [Sulfuriferula plumbiphila]